MSHSRNHTRRLTRDDMLSLERLLRTSEYIYQRFTLEELPLLLQHYPATGVFSGPSLHGFLLSQTVNAPSAWIGGFGVSWTESNAYLSLLSTLLEHLQSLLMAQGVHYLHYSGNDLEQDWLRVALLARGFTPYRYLYAYDKYDSAFPSWGNQQITVRPVNLLSGAQDMSALLTLEQNCFEDLWRYDRVAFIDIAKTHPYFVVAELNGQVVGYQFNALDGDIGYLVRIAVHPSMSKQGIGTRLMAEAIRFFQQARVSRILLNTQDDNTSAHRLYERFGFIRMPQMGFVLRKSL